MNRQNILRQLQQRDVSSERPGEIWCPFVPNILLFAFQASIRSKQRQIFKNRGKSSYLFPDKVVAFLVLFLAFVATEMDSVEHTWEVV